MSKSNIPEIPADCNRIILEVHRLPKLSDEVTGTVRINAEAEIALRQIVRASGLPIRQVASQIIMQGAALVEIREIK